MQTPRAVLFDLDETLAESFHAPTPAMIERLRSLLPLLPVAIITGAGFARIEDQFLKQLGETARIPSLFLMPNSSAECFVYNNETWERQYKLELTIEDREKIRAALEESIAETELLRDIPTYGLQLIDRTTQIAYAFLGIEAPYEAKKLWDPSGEKRALLKRELEKKIPEFEVLIGGLTSIDITKKGINKSYGVRWLAERLELKPSDMYYVGDSLFPGGNDEVVIETGIVTRKVADPEETLSVIDELCRVCAK